METQNDGAAREALSAIDAARTQAADRLITPWWYHPILGLLTAGYFVTITLGGLVGTLIALPVFIVGVVLLVSNYKKRTGVWISGFSAGRASRWAFGLACVLVAAVLTVFVLHALRGLVWPVWVAAAVTFIAVNVFGRLFDTTLRTSLRAGTLSTNA